MKPHYSFIDAVQKFPGTGGWVYVAVPKKYTGELKKKQVAWGMYPITAEVKGHKWNTKLMLLKGGDFMVALRADVRKKTGVVVGDRVKVLFSVG